jgi:restriction system protein
MKKSKGPEFLRFFHPILQVLQKLGGAGTAAEIVDQSIELAEVTEAEQESVNKNGQSRIKNQVHWARQYLVWGGYLDSSKRGVWGLTDKARTTRIDALEPLTLFNTVHKVVVSERQGKGIPIDEQPIPEEGEVQDYRSRLLDIIRGLSPNGFERLCQRLLRESGFQQVMVTGQTGDGGIDGIGTLKVNPFVSFNVLFQCKRYQGSVTPSKVRDFRGAMQGRADKGLILTTGTFTLEAKKEARRDGVPPIELVDGDALIDMFEQLELGLIPKRTFDIDELFFEEFQPSVTSAIVR